MNLKINISLVTCLLVGISLRGWAQVNLVPNGSFESYTLCPNAGNENIESASNWSNPTTYSPDYFNSCATDTMYGQSIPKNGFGFQSAKSGVGYAGLISMAETDAREYIQAALTDSLIAGTSYTVKFYVSVADSSPYASNNIGAYFSTNPVSAAHSWVLPYTPQIENNSLTNPLDDRYGWTEVSGTFIALGGEKYITIGNFNNDLNTDTTFFSDASIWLSFSYHYVDDVSVTETFPSSVNESTQAKISVYPNPSNGIIYVNSPTLIESLTIHSSLGQLVFSQYADSTNFQVDLSQFSKGVYNINISTSNSIITKKIIINR
jgi:OOP family OmpA-OmpF porin